MDLYGLLEIAPTATKDEIKKAYRKAALNTHPDRAAPEQKKEREEQFRAVNAAYEILSDDTNRALYDKHGTWPPPEEAQHRSSTQSSSQRRTHPAYDIRQQQRMFAYFNMRASAPAPFFMFTDPISLFNAIFAHELRAMGVRAAAASSSIPPSSSAQPVEQSYSRTQQYLPASSSSSGTRPQTAVQTSTTTTTTTTSRNGTTTSTSTVTKDGGFSDGAGGWIKESKVIKLSPTGARETTIKKTDYDGTVYITRINGDGVESYAVSINGRETPMSKPGPSRPLKGPHAFSTSRSQPAYNERVTQQGSTSQATQYVSYPAASTQQTTTRRSPPGTNYAVADPPPPDPAKHHTMSAKPQSNRTSPNSGYQTSSSTATYVPASSTTRTSPTNYQPAPNPASGTTSYVPAQRKSPTTYEPAPTAPSCSNDLRRNNSMPSASAVPNHIASMPRPQSPFSNFHSRQRLAAESSQPMMVNSGSNKTPPTSDRESDREKYRSQSRSASKTRGPVDDREVAYDYSSTKVRASSRSADPQPRAATSASAYTTTFSNQKASAAMAHPAYAAAVPSAQANYAAYDKSRTASSAAQGVEYGRSQTSQGYTAPVRPPSAMARPGSAMPHARAGVDLAQQAQQAARQPRPSGPPTNGLGLEAVPPVQQSANIAGALPPVSGSQHRMKSYSYDQMPRPAAGNPMAAYAHPGMPVYNFNPMVAPAAAMDPWAAHQDALYHKKRMQQV